ncbi:hypothetical protein [Aureibacter tunicatorum]|uniref:Uncharacterized protein n=1 Tax=Aureibacter tunicatorum TaxID=866807 RepID=A0AAE3XSM1_9BACT|nr:hypothetical protein [Aureibacter tunicatorum]MDR6241141.1 hypothetical protein [Aureibacter tunicatorum]BDD03918.1 hypothetical protein AUTU_14010 [Aureibacter tunicatorum]
MLNFDEGTIKRIKSSNTKTGDKLYLISRYIEEEYRFETKPNHWDLVFDSLDKEDRIFYKVWLWICYVEWENLVSPISEFDEVFGDEKRNRLLTYLENDNNDSDDLESYFTLDGEAGRILLDWGLEKLKTTYNTV